MEETGTKGISEEERTGGEDEDEGTEASGGRKGELKARGREEGGGGTTCMYLLFYETSNKCGAVAVIGSTLSLSGALLLPV